MKAALFALVTAAALAVSAGPVAARPPQYSANHHVPLGTASFYDEARYGEFLPHSSPASAFSRYGVAYPHPYYRNAPPASPPQPSFSPSGRYLGTYNGGLRGSWRR